MKSYISVILFFLLFTTQGFSQEEMTLEKALSLGLENNYGIKIDDQYIQIAENNNTWARAGKTPTVDLGGTFSNTLVNDNNPASFLQGTYYAGSLGATLSGNWVVYNGGRFQIAKDQLSLAISQQELNKQTNIHNLFRSIYQQYYAVIFAEEQLEVLNKNLKLSKDRLSYEKTKKEFGASNSYNLLQFENAIVSDSTNLIAQLQSIEVAKRNLYNTLDISGMENYKFSERLSIVPEEIDEEKLKEVLSEENYTLKTLELVASLNQLNTKLEAGARKPTVSIGGSVGYSQNGFNFFADNPTTGEPFPYQWSNRFNAGLNANASWNLYDGGVKRTNIQNAKLQEAIDQMSILEAAAELNNQLDILISNYNNQKRILQMADDQIALSSRNLEMTEERFKGGQLSSLDFRNVQVQYLNAAFSKVSAMYNLILTKSEIDFQVGLFGG